MLSAMRRFLALSTRELVEQRPAGAGEDDVHFVEALVEAVVAEYTAPGDVVLDPFAGYGTTLAVSERMGRRAVGVELLPERVRATRRRAPSATVIEGDARRLAELGIGAVDLCLTSPPYMTAANHPENPLTAYATRDGDYRTYLAQLAEVFGAAGRLLRPGGHLVVNAANLETGGTVTPLAWDIAAAVAGEEHLSFRGEVYLHWDRPPPGVTGDYCLVFRADAQPRQ